MVYTRQTWMNIANYMYKHVQSRLCVCVECTQYVIEPRAHGMLCNGRNGGCAFSRNIASAWNTCKVLMYLNDYGQDEHCLDEYLVEKVYWMDLEVLVFILFIIIEIHQQPACIYETVLVSKKILLKSASSTKTQVSVSLTCVSFS